MTDSSAHEEEAIRIFGEQDIDDAVRKMTAVSQYRPEIILKDQPGDIEEIKKMVCKGMIKNLYVMNGALVQVEKISGSQGMSLGITRVDVPVLFRVLSENLEMFKLKDSKVNGVTIGAIKVPHIPRDDILKAVLSTTNWQGVPELVGITMTPVFGPKGTLIQKPGYDKETRLYYDPEIPVPEVSESPSEAEIAKAKKFLSEDLLSDFHWVNESDKSNYLGLLMSPAVQPLVKLVFPLGAISANVQGSGKTLLGEMIGKVYSYSEYSFPEGDSEFRKNITSILSCSAEPVILFDNVAENRAIDYPSFAKLLTSSAWADRRLGTNTTFVGANNRLWLLTGNNITLGGDMRSRTVLVELKSRVADPSRRKGFKLGNLETWLELPENRVQIVWSVLTLIQAWVSAGGIRDEDQVKRQFTTWAQVIGGVLKHHGFEGFLGNEDRVNEADSEETEWINFLTTWEKIYGDKTLKAQELIDDQEEFMGKKSTKHAWGGFFISPAGGWGGEGMNSRKLGHLLKGHKGRPHGKLCLEAKTVNGSLSWWVEKVQE